MVAEWGRYAADFVAWQEELRDDEVAAESGKDVDGTPGVRVPSSPWWWLSAAVASWWGVFLGFGDED